VSKDRLTFSLSALVNSGHNDVDASRLEHATNQLTLYGSP
jgi:hypothetical protein